MYTAHFRVLKNMLCHNEIIIQSRRSQISDFQTQILLGKCFISLQAEFFFRFRQALNWMGFKIKRPSLEAVNKSLKRSA